MALPKAKQYISPSQGLLLLMQHYQNDEKKLHLLKRLYLNDVSTPAIHQQIMTLLADPRLSAYQISESPEIIMSDPVRRYFETHLAYETLKHGLNSLDEGELSIYLAELKGLMPYDTKPWLTNYINSVLRGEYDTSGMDEFQKEYATYINKINTGQLFQGFNPVDLEKIKMLISCAFLGVVAALHVKLPLDIYGTGIYESQKKGKRLIKPKINRTTRNPHLGLLKGHNPVPIGDIATQDHAPDFVKPSDLSTYNVNSVWVRYALRTLVNPYSNSISGTILCQLRTLARIRNENNSFHFTDDEHAMHHFIKYFIATMLYGSGGHSLLEYITPVQIAKSRQEFKSTPDFDQISLYELFLENNEDAFETALDKTLLYNQAIMLRQQVLAEISPQITPNIEEKPLFQPEPTITRISNLKQDYLNTQNRFFKPKNTRKLAIIDRELKQIIRALQEFDLPKAKILIDGLKHTISSQFGTSNIWGEEKKSLTLINEIQSMIEFDIKNHK